MSDATNQATPMYGYQTQKPSSQTAPYNLADRTPSQSLLNVISELSNLPLGSSVLDLGCGDGVIGRHAIKRNYTFTAVDIESAAIESLQKIFIDSPNNDRALVGDITKLDTVIELEPASFDAIVSWRVLHGIAPTFYKEIFQEVKKLLKPSGSFYISLASSEDWKAKALGETYDPIGVNDCSGVMFRNHGIARTRIFPVHFFSKDELIKLGQENGFDLEDVDTFQESSGYEHLQDKKNTYLFAHFKAR